MQWCVRCLCLCVEWVKKSALWCFYYICAARVCCVLVHSLVKEKWKDLWPYINIRWTLNSVIQTLLLHTFPPRCIQTNMFYRKFLVTNRYLLNQSTEQSASALWTPPPHLAPPKMILPKESINNYLWQSCFHPSVCSLVSCLLDKL